MLLHGIWTCADAFHELVQKRSHLILMNLVLYAPFFVLGEVLAIGFSYDAPLHLIAHKEKVSAQKVN